MKTNITTEFLKRHGFNFHEAFECWYLEDKKGLDIISVRFINDRIIVKVCNIVNRVEAVNCKTQRDIKTLIRLFTT